MQKPRTCPGLFRFSERFDLVPMDNQQALVSHDIIDERVTLGAKPPRSVDYHGNRPIGARLGVLAVRSL